MPEAKRKTGDPGVVMKGNKKMAWTVKRIQEGDYGCEERPAEERNQVIVTLENEDGLTRQLTADDDWLYTMGIDEGSLWPEEGMPAALEKRT
jgi:hypothetical protein